MKNRSIEALEKLKKDMPWLITEPNYPDDYWDGLHDILSKYSNKKEEKLVESNKNTKKDNK